MPLWISWPHKNSWNSKTGKTEMPIGGEKKVRTISDKRVERTLDGEELAPAIDRFNREMVRMKATMSPDEAKMVVRKYFAMQKTRVGMRLAERSMMKRDIPHDIVQYLGDQIELMEKELQRLLLPYAKSTVPGRWLLSQKGIGPVIAAGLLSEIKIERAPTAGHILSYAGQIEGQRLVKGQTREWNAHLKVICYYAGESFAKSANREDAYYGQVYKWRKMYEWQKNQAGELQHRAAEALASRVWDTTTHAYAWYTGKYKRADFRGQFITGIEPSEGEKGLPMLPPAHIYARSKAYAIRTLIYHLHQVMYEDRFNRPVPFPYAIQQQGHADFYPPPSWVVNDKPISTAPWQKEFVLAVKDNQVPDDEADEFISDSIGTE